ncbi:hypothetical protein HPB47_022551, partial [Ixodes persulcatus]
VTKSFQDQRVVCLSDGFAWDTGLCGGKASSLAVLSAMVPLTREKFVVPGAVVLTARAYDVLRDHNRLETCLKELDTYHRLNIDQKKALSIRICEAVERAEIPPSLVLQLETQLRNTMGDHIGSKRFAVRSSAVGEDSEEMSCAGQMETFLNVAGLQEVMRSAVKCWASQFRHPALEYKWQHGQPLEAPMAVLVQEMVQSDVAGVLFTCDPVSGDPTRLVINANYGLGEGGQALSAGVMALETLNVVAMVSGIDGGGSALRRASVGVVADRASVGLSPYDGLSRRRSFRVDALGLFFLTLGISRYLGVCLWWRRGFARRL